ncbi:MAG: hypothetical protein HC904_01820 [Blastochloris sp.]|nr:hypothetical protein [Blastochloris sp.]
MTVTHELDWEKIRAKARSEAWARDFVRVLKETCHSRMEVWPHDPPMEQSEWTHYYFCNDDAARLSFDFKKSGEHECPKCGKIYRGHPWDGAWRSIVHGSLVANMERAAILARIEPEPERYVEYLRRLVLFYAEHYEGYAVHGERAGKGKIMPQCLDESIVLISVGRYLSWGRGQNWFSEREMQLLREKWFRPAVELLKPQIGKIHNIHVWMQSAMATAAQWLGDRALLEWSIESEFGWKRQIELGDEGGRFLV